MRTLIKTEDYSFVPGTRTITISNNEAFTAHDIRLMANETQKVVLASLMHADNIVSAVGNVITYANTLPALLAGDVLTIEIDFVPPVTSLTGIITDIETYLDVINGEVI